MLKPSKKNYKTKAKTFKNYITKAKNPKKRYKSKAKILPKIYD